MKEFTNEDRNRYYGKKIGDIVHAYGISGVPCYRNAVVTGFTSDNNRIMIKPKENHEIDWVAEWCEIVTKVEDINKPAHLLQTVRALSWKEPFASLMIIGKIETRTWDTKYRGLVLICASQKKYTEGDIIAISGEVQAQRLLVDFVNKKRIIENPGKAIAIGRLIDSRPMTPNDESATFVKYRPGLYCHVYADVTPIKPFDWKGSQGWRTVSEEIKSKIEFL